MHFGNITDGLLLSFVKEFVIKYSENCLKGIVKELYVKFSVKIFVVFFFKCTHIRNGCTPGWTYVKSVNKSHNIIWLISERFVAKVLKPHLNIPWYTELYWKFSENIEGWLKEICYTYVGKLKK